jgi:hypothetical protein
MKQCVGHLVVAAPQENKGAMCLEAVVASKFTTGLVNKTRGTPTSTRMGRLNGPGLFRPPHE